MLKKLLLSTALGVCVSQTPAYAWDSHVSVKRMDDSVRFIVGVESINTRGRESRLYVTCREKTAKKNLFIEFPYLYFTDYKDDLSKYEINYRLDSDSAQKIEFFQYPGSYYVFITPRLGSIDFIKNMFDKSRFLVAIQDERTRVYEFDISGLREAIKRIRKACNW